MYSVTQSRKVAALIARLESIGRHDISMRVRAEAVRQNAADRSRVLPVLKLIPADVAEELARETSKEEA